MTIALIDDHELILESLSLLLNKMEEVSSVTCFENPEKALEACKVENFDLIITDYNMPEMTGSTFTLKLRKEKPKSKVLMLTVAEDYETIKEGFQAGILGYVMKKASKSELREAIVTVSEGKRFVSESVLTELLNPSVAKENFLEVHNETKALTSREIDVVELIGREMSTKEIADELFVSIATVEKHRHNVLKKLGVKNSIGILKYAMQHKLIG
ncbi:MAG: response regulator transcription factor [Cytophagales bacterium]|nr:response regulator transcription factor [Cytophagales bacterium]